MAKKDRSMEPYRVLMATKLPREKDRRVRLSEADKEDIRARHKRGEEIRSIARVYEGKCTRRAIQYTIFPERYATLLKAAKSAQSRRAVQVHQRKVGAHAERASTL